MPTHRKKIKGYYSALITTYEETVSAKILGLGIGAGGGSEITALPSHSSSILCLENSHFFHGILCCLECTYSELDEDEPEDELEPGPRPPLSLLPRRLLRPPSRWPPFEPMNMVVRVWWWRCRRSSSLSPSWLTQLKQFEGAIYFCAGSPHLFPRELPQPP